ncbi:MAG TPA: endolytic transglycosylase MltG [Solirubrobacterales bacterium]|nr:endolytic transglycosylase MltG [Solirubrobacterales bacterium]
MSEDWLNDDPFANPDDPAAREREQRRREREEKRRQREEKQRQREAKQAKAEEKTPPPPPPAPPPSSPPPPTEEPALPVEEPAPPPPPPPPPPTEEPPLPPRTPEEEFWDEDPEPLESPQAPASPAPVVAARNGGSQPPRRRPAALGRIGRHPFLIFAVVAALFALWFLNSLFQPFHGDGSGRVQVTIPKGSSVSEVGDLLSEKGVIDNSTLFQVRVTLAGKRSEIYSGNFTLADGMSYGAAIDALSTPPVKRTLTVTIPEGYTRSQAAQLVEEVGVPGDYTKATIKSKYLDPADYGGKGAKDLEGFLFPDTFELKPNAPVEDLVQLQLLDFKERIKGVDMSYAKSKNLTVFDVLTIASMIEEEAGVDSQRKLVAAVIYNRLRDGMPLGIDATIRFATGNYTEPLTESELAIDSPYNSRTNTGLPPGPIANPGLASIEAAAHPAKTDHLFYVTTPGACGKLTFAETEAEFEDAVDAYNSAREAAGGNSPDSCEE